MLDKTMCRGYYIRKKIKSLQDNLQGFYLVLEAGLEPAQPQWSRDFKSLVSTIPPFEQPLLPQCGTWPFCDSGAKVSSFAKISKENLQ